MNAEPFLKPQNSGMPGWIRAGLAGWIVALPLSTACGEDQPAPKPTIPRMMPKGLMVMEPAFEGPDELRWRHGEKLTGKLTSFMEGRWSWTSTLFSAPLPLRGAQIRKIDFSSPLLRRDSPFRVILTDGSHFCGLPEKAEGERLFFRSTHCGLVELKLDCIVAMERIGGADLILGGPQALVAGTAKDKDKRGTRPTPDEDQDTNAARVKVPWSYAAGGAVSSAAFGQELKLSMDQLPEKCVLELAWRSEEAPAFSFRMAEQGVSRAVETWGDELVLTDGIQFATAGKVFKDDDRAVHLRLAWDRKSGQSQLFDADGRMLVELKAPPEKSKTAAKNAPKAKEVGLLGALKALVGLGEVVPSEPEEPVEAPPENGIQFQNKGPALKIGQFSLTAWSGQPLPALLKDCAGAETAEAALPGEFAGLKEGTLTLRQPDGMMKEVPLESVRSVRWNRQGKEARDPGLTQLWFSDGDLLCGRLEKVEDGKAVFDCPVAAAPVVASLKWDRALVLAEPEEKPAMPDLKKMDRMVAGNTSLHGTIVPDAAGPLPAFQLAGAFEPVIPAYAKDLVLTWTRTPESLAKRAEALLHVKGNESFPITLGGVSREKVDFTWDITTRREVPMDQVQALQFANPPIPDAGFDGPGWRTLDSTSKKPVRKGGTVILSPGSGIGHAFIMQGAELGFTLARAEGLAMMRVKLFTQGTDRTSGTVNFLLADFGSEVYGGQERGEGQLLNQNSVASKEVNEVVIRLGDKAVELVVNGAVLAQVRLGEQKHKNSGTGIILETAALWGNQPGEVKLAGFHSEVSPFLAAAPQFSEEARREALLLPRMRRDDPPRQVLIGRNGDLLRGEIEATTSTHLAFRSGLESLKVPIDRVAAAVWLTKPDPAPKSGKPEPATPKTGNPKEPEAAKADKPLFDELIEQNTPAIKKPPAKPAPDPQWLDLTNGGRIALQVQSWTASTVSGLHPLLGECRIPTGMLGNLATKAPAPGQASALLSDWKLVRTPDPVLPEAGGDASALNGKPAPGFKLSLMEGEDFVLEKQKGKVVVLDFWATWCGPCVQSLPGLVEAMAGFPPEQVSFLAVNQAEAKPLVKRFVEARHLKMAVGLDTDQAVAKKYGVEGIPHTVVIGPDGTIAFVKTGASSGGEKEIAAAVQKVLPATAASPAPAKTE